MEPSAWEQALASAVRQANDKPPGYVRLPLRSAERRIVKGLDRSLAEVDAGLRTVFSRLMAGSFAWPLYLWGPVGTGKTLAALSLCDVVSFAQYWTVEYVVDAILSNDYHSRPPWKRQSPDLVVLDELGARQNVSDLQYMAVKEFADWRERSAKNVAIYISNHSPAAIEDLYDYRIASRILRGTVFHLDGPDRRMERNTP